MKKSQNDCDSKIQLKRSRLSLALYSAFMLSICSSVSAENAAANIKGASDNDDVEVITISTGTRRLDRTASETSVPVDIIDSSEIERSGLTELNDLLSNAVPSFNFPQAALADATDHVRPAVLRGMAPDHTLVLINGKRRHSSPVLNLNSSVGRGSSGVDLNTIPSASIKRIEVLRDGAAAQYGSDAIAGVINIVLKDDNEGGSLKISYGKFDSTLEGVKELESVSVDQEGNLAFTEGNDISRSDGATTTLSGHFGMNLFEDGFLTFSGEYRDRNSTNRSSWDPREQYLRLDGELDPRELTINRYIHETGASSVEDYNFFYNLKMPVTDSIEFYSFGSVGHREGKSSQLYRRAGDSRNVPEIYPDGFLPFITSNIDDDSLAVGFIGETNEWNWDASINFGEDEFDLGVDNSLNTSLALSDVANGNLTKTKFKNGTIKYSHTVANIDVSKVYEVNWLPDLLLVAAGVEFRKEQFSIESGELASYTTILDIDGLPIAGGGSQSFAGFQPNNEQNRDRDNTSIYLELDTDILENVNITGALRYEDYSDFGSTSNYKFTVRYETEFDLAFRAATSTGFRAPSLTQSFYSSTQTVVDASTGLSNETGLFPVDHKAAIALGAKALKAEESTNQSFGLVYTPSTEFALTIDFYRIDLDDRIVLSENLAGAEVASVLVNAGVDGVSSARYFTNAIDTITQGVDVVGSYDFDLTNYGNLRFTLGYNRNMIEVSRVADNPEKLSSLGQNYQLFSDGQITRFEKGTPSHKLNLSSTWSIDNFRATLRATKYGTVVDPLLGRETIDSIVVTDLDISYELNENILVTIGANNILDEKPQERTDILGSTHWLPNAFPYSGMAPAGRDGRYFYTGVTLKF